MALEKAKRENLPLRMVILGPAGAGKTYTALSIAEGMVGKGYDKIAVIDAEKGRAKHYADEFQFSISILEDHWYTHYIDALKEVAAAKIPFCVVDGYSPAWERFLEVHAEITEKSASKNSYTAWRTVTPQHSKLVQAFLEFPGHIIVTMRAKMGYEMQKDSKGKTVPVFTGVEPIARSGTEYEFDIVAHLDHEHVMTVQKADYSELKEKSLASPGKAVGERLAKLLKGELKNES